MPEEKPKRKRKSEEVGQILDLKIVCPKCNTQTLQGVRVSETTHDFDCPHCKSSFTTHFYMIRASRSSVYEALRRQPYHIRVINGHRGEELLEFSTPLGIRLELRSKDYAGFTFFKSKLSVVQNFTINKYWAFGAANPRATGLKVLAVALIIFLIMIAIVLSQARA